MTEKEAAKYVGLKNSFGEARVEFRADSWMTFSRTKGDHLPLTDFTLEAAPCADRGKRSGI